MNATRNKVLAWILFGLIAITVASGLIFFLVINPAEYLFSLNDFFTSLGLFAFAFVGALIISRQPRNAIGWLMMLLSIAGLIAIPVDVYLKPFLSASFIPPQSPAPVLIFAVWFSSWSFMLLLLATMFIMVLFPTGRPLNRRWGWLNYFGLGLAGVIILLTTLNKTLSPGLGSVDWTVANPIGFLEEGEWVNYVSPVFILSMVAWVLLSVVSLFVRFRNSRGVERAQIKWLFFAAALYIVGLIPSFFIDPLSAEKFWPVLNTFFLLAIPASIAIAILRYRLYDIDILIRRTLVYGALTLLLLVVYFGSVVLLQQALRALTGQDSPLAIVISTLIIAAIFNPLRLRVQETIDRRFYRRKYDAQQALSAFAATARDEVDLENLQSELVSIVQETMQPEQVSLWLRAGERE